MITPGYYRRFTKRHAYKTDYDNEEGHVRGGSGG